jgi:hypothetical protein
MRLGVVLGRKMATRKQSTWDEEVREHGELLG